VEIENRFGKAMGIIWEELVGSFPGAAQAAGFTIRLLIAMLLGAVIGLQRERTGKPAGLRTHVLVSLGAALFVLAPLESGMDNDAVSRVIQGLVTGIGFLGAGAILKLQEKREVEGLTTAAGIWMTAAIGLAVGLGRLGLAIMTTILTWITLSLLGQMEQRMNEKGSEQKPSVDEK
jgi:putative Mg2+ transporter-C (MgtC) family protein